MKNSVYLSLIILCLEFPVYAATFNTDFLAGESAKADLSRFDENALISEGKYEVDVYINHDWRGYITVQLSDNNKDILITAKDAENLGILIEPSQSTDQTPISLASLIHEGTYKLDISTFKLNINIAQAYLKQEMKGYVAADYWEQGIPGAFISYNTNYFRSHNNQNGTNRTSDNAYIALNNGINLMGWQFRDQSTYTYSNHNSGRWTNNNRYMQKGLSNINSELRLGDSYTNSDTFDSLFFRGISLKTDLRMYPDAYQGFSPTVQGVAQSNALVSIYQNNTLIYQHNVPPGPFIINDILSTGSGGDLNVEVKEANGTINRFIVPFSSVPNMLKKGMSKYEFYAGEARTGASNYRPNFVQGSYQRGFNNLLTGYTGSILSDDYYSVLLGGGFNLPVGALSIDMTHAESRFPQDITKKGQSYRVAYSRYFNQTGTNFSLAAYRYSTKGYLTLSDSISLQDWLNDGHAANSYAHQKNTFNLSMNQTLGPNAGTIFISGTLRDYWGQQNSSKEYQIGYNNNWDQINYSLNASRTRYNDNVQGRNKEETQYYLNISLPFSVFGEQAYLTANSSMTNGNYKNSNIGISGATGDHQQLNYNVNIADQREGNTTLNSNISYKTPVATLTTNYSHSSQYKQLSIGASGSIVAYKGGILTSNQLGETFAIVDAPGVKNAAVNGDKTMITNSSGVVLVPYLSAYRKNAVMLDTSDLDDDSAELMGNIKDVVPYAGAITYIDFKTDKRQNLMLRAMRENGKPLPFGTEVTDNQNEVIGYVGQGSSVFVKADEIPTLLFIRLNEATESRCIIQDPKWVMDSSLNTCISDKK